ncbi:BF3164 family lipoprotein [Roseivirga sp. UBA1976]|uniref:BF3164 family lipoprotein n=1 Tax=Roseivirga sp. UBA1976 TaxID=1947386 RepID=UPI002580924D|nr:BF3164 family lipoprotein [Roseivirga sp. UBA1976]MEC7752702.1 BF3164 family lipoprotein [Bacteroidota bacterium]|tara:strand:+ start:5308 stop:6414 length:1107 start_codon:yes stop_codon:yes gene_type:complete
MNKYLTVIVFILLSCSFEGNSSAQKEGSGIKGVFAYSDFEYELNLSGDVIALDSLKLPLRIKVDGAKERMYITTASHSKWLQVYDIRSKKLINELVSKGQGPGEMLNATDVQLSHSKNELYIHDMIQKRIDVYDLEKTIGEKSLMPKNTIELDSLQTYYPKIDRKGHVIDLISSLSGNEENRLYKLSLEDAAIIKEGGFYPEIDYPQQSPQFKSQVFMAFMNTDPEAEYFALAHAYTDYLELYDSDFNLISSARGPELFDPLLETKSVGGGGSMVAPLKDSRDAYTYPVLGNNMIYVLFDGKNTSEQGFHQDELFLFNYKLEPLIRFKLNIPIYAFDIDWEKNILYGLTLESPEDGNEVAVVKYDLNK